MDNAVLEQYYESVILSQYSDIDLSTKIIWKDHGKVGLDAWAHYFEDKNGVEHVLLYEDYAGGDYLNDNLSHEIVKCGADDSIQVSLSSHKQIDNVIGYFTLYKEKSNK